MSGRELRSGVEKGAGVRRLLLSGCAAVAVAVGLAGCGSDKSFHPPKLSSCQVKTSDNDVSLNPEQMANAATISAVGVRRGLPDQAVVVALATALQESKLTNLPDGDRDSIGLFQQRPSQGWGQPDQLNDPRYAAGTFYDHLVRVNGWQDMRVTDAAQAVQRSAHPEEYQKWAAESETLAGALVGAAGGTLSCSLHGGPQKRGAAARTALLTDLRLDWGDGLVANKSGGTGVRIPTDGQRSGWQFAHWIVAYAEQTGVRSVRYDDHRWTAGGGSWRTVKAEQVASGTPAPVVVTVYGPKKTS